MENLVMQPFNNIYSGKRVFITGHTGFKGSWLAKWLEMMGADVFGYALSPYSTPSHYSVISWGIKSEIGDITNQEQLEKALVSFNPDIVFHLAAQPLVRYAYREPFETYNTNVMGTLNVLEACRKAKNVKAILCVTTDKVYENKERTEGYKESDRLGGFDPYSSSKACAELLIQSYRDSYFNLNDYSKSHKILLASARGGNVVGGGDWSEDRLIPDIVRAHEAQSSLEIRNPSATRPWQHVLDCLSGYLNLGAKLLNGDKEYAKAWNFGPTDKPVSVDEIVRFAQGKWTNLSVILHPSPLHETSYLALDCSQALSQLDWKPLLSNNDTFEWTFDWYNKYAQGSICTEDQIFAYQNLLHK